MEKRIIRDKRFLRIYKISIPFNYKNVSIPCSISYSFFTFYKPPKFSPSEVVLMETLNEKKEGG